MPPGTGADPSAKAKVQMALTQPAKIGILLEIASGFFQLDTMFFLMAYTDYNSLSKGAVARLNAINPMIYSSGGTLAQKLSLIGTWIFERHVKQGSNVRTVQHMHGTTNLGSASSAISGGSAVNTGAPMMINLPSEQLEALERIYAASGKPFTPTSYRDAYATMLNTLVLDVRYATVYKARL